MVFWRAWQFASGWDLVRRSLGKTAGTTFQRRFTLFILVELNLDDCQEEIWVSRGSERVCLIEVARSWDRHASFRLTECDCHCLASVDWEESVHSSTSQFGRTSELQHCS